MRVDSETFHEVDGLWCSDFESRVFLHSPVQTVFVEILCSDEDVVPGVFVEVGAWDIEYAVGLVNILPELVQNGGGLGAC
jgi:hypothetical protein